MFAEIGRYHHAIVSGLDTNRASTVWQRLHDEQGLQVSLRSSQMRRSRARRYLCLFMRLRRHRYLPNQARRMQPTVLRDDPLPGQEAQGDYGCLGLWTDPQTEKRKKIWAFAMVLSHSRHMFVGVVNTRADQCL